MSFPEVQSGCKVAPGDTKGFCSREPLRAGRRAEPQQKMAAPAPCGGRLTLRRSEGICHRTPPAPQSPRCPPSWGSCRKVPWQGGTPKIGDLKINRTRASSQ